MNKVQIKVLFPQYSRGIVALALFLCTVCLPVVIQAATWRVGDRDQSWQLYPVSFLLNAGETFRPDYALGGANAVEIVVDDDGDGLVDEDPVDLEDQDGDGLFNEDPPDGIDNDRDGLVDEDGPDPQRDNDGDGLLNEDGLLTGGVIYNESLRTEYSELPFFRDITPEEASANPTGKGYGYGDDDYDGRYNEDPVDGVDNDGDGLIDEDGEIPPSPLPASWLQPVFAYEAAQADSTLSFVLDADEGVFRAANGIEARLEQRRFTPSDWIRPIKADSKRNLVRLADDRFLSGVFGTVDPFSAARWGSAGSGTPRGGDAGYGQMGDGDIFTARVVRGAGANGFTANLRGVFIIDLIRIRPRPDFPELSPSTFFIYYGGNEPRHFQQRLVAGEFDTRLLVSEFIIPRQVDQTSPVIKEFRLDGGELGEPTEVRVLDMRSQQRSLEPWEIAEFEAYGRGYSLEASYVTEIIDVGTPTPRFQRFFDPDDPSRPVTMERTRTLDANKNGSIEPDELASSQLSSQFERDVNKVGGHMVSWGKVRWRGQVEGVGGNVQVRVRTGTSLDTRIYQRRVGRGLFSSFVGTPLVLDWPERGSSLDVFAYAALSGLDRPRFSQLPYNTPSNRDGIEGGWTFWSTPFDFEKGLVDENGVGGVSLPLPPLTRYIQFRFDFESNETSGVRIDFIEFDFGDPVVSGSVVAEVFPATTEQLGKSETFQYVVRPNFNQNDLGFNRLDIVVPSEETHLDNFLVDDLAWTRLEPEGEDPKAWLDNLSIEADRTFAAAVYRETATGLTKLGIKTRILDESDFPLGQEKEIQINFRAPVFKLLTRFDSWVWNDQGEFTLEQPTTPGNAADQLPSDQVEVTVEAGSETLKLRSLGPNPFTPNGDGINDQVFFEFEVFLLTEQTAIDVTIYDLAGQPLRQLDPIFAAAGKQQLSWDGKDDGGKQMPPGLYLYYIAVDSDTKENKTLVGTVAVAY